MERNFDHAPALASLLAAGIGSLTLGLATVAAEVSLTAKSLLNFYPPVGPLSGKTTVAVVVYAVSWVILHKVLAGKSPDLGKFSVIVFALLAVGLLLTFPPVFTFFASH